MEAVVLTDSFEDCRVTTRTSLELLEVGSADVFQEYEASGFLIRLHVVVQNYHEPD